MNQSPLFPRRGFFKMLLPGTALSLAALEKLKAASAQKIVELNQKYLEDESPDGVYWEEIRELFHFENRFIMMNNGTLGPMPKTVFNTLSRYFQVQMNNPYDAYNYLPTFREAVRTSWPTSSRPARMKSA